MITTEYARFMQTLISADVSDGVRKIANLILENLEILIPLSTAQGQRIKKIVKLAQANWDSISSEIQTELENTEKQACTLNQLKMLNVGPFRGFAKQEEFDLTSKVVLIYGPNGTGKSSFCEALEYALLGNVSEAESKRFRNQNEYALLERFLAGLRQIEGIRTLGALDLSRRVGVVSVDFTKRCDNAEVADRLANEFGVLTRCGLHCAPNAHKTYGTFPQGTVRFSFNSTNTAEEIDAALSALDEIL